MNTLWVCVGVKLQVTMLTMVSHHSPACKEVQGWLTPWLSWVCQLRARAEFLGTIMRISQGLWGKEQTHLKEVFMKFGYVVRDCVKWFKICFFSQLCLQQHKVCGSRLLAFFSNEHRPAWDSLSFSVKNHSEKTQWKNQKHQFALDSCLTPGSVKNTGAQGCLAFFQS